MSQMTPKQAFTFWVIRAAPHADANDLLSFPHTLQYRTPPYRTAPLI